MWKDMRYIDLIYSADAETEKGIVESKSVFWNSAKEFLDIIQKRPFDMTNPNFEKKRFDNHTLPIEDLSFPYAGQGFYASQLFNINHFKSYRVVWKLIEADKENELKDLPQDLKDTIVNEKSSISEKDSLIVVYIERFCVEYHNNNITKPNDLVNLLKIKDSFFSGLIELHNKLIQKLH